MYNSDIYVARNGAIMDENIGKKFGEWEILNATQDSRPGKYYECMCSCGKIQNVHWVSMKLGRSKRCWDCGRAKTGKANEMVGQKFGKWIVLSHHGISHNSYSYLCRCECGFESVIHGPHLRQKKSTQCLSCSNRDKSLNNKKHGHATSSTYKTWNQMHQRCKNPKSTHYHRYGGRGISVCERWNDFRNFLRDMGERPGKGFDLDRIDNDGNYEPGNCRWVSHKENCLNQSRNKKPQGL